MKIISIFSLKHLFYLHYAVSVLTIVFLEVLQILIKANFNIIFFVHLGSRDLLKNRQRYRVIFFGHPNREIIKNVSKYRWQFLRVKIKVM